MPRPSRARSTDPAPDPAPAGRMPTQIAPPHSAPLTLALAITGASGSLFAAEMLRTLHRDPRVARVHLVVSPSALRVLAAEITSPASPTPTSTPRDPARNSLIPRLLGHTSAKITVSAHEDIGAPIASGSYPVAAMIVLPCSMGTLAGIAHGLAANLIERAADVCLKERRPLVLCVRETPLNLIHIRNMAAVTEAGATVFPLIPTFYNHPHTLDDIARNYVDRVLAHIGLPQPDAFVWGKSSE